MERAVFVPDLDRLPPPDERYDRLYLGSEFCARRLPGEHGLHEALAAAAQRGLGFTLVTPFLDEPGLGRTLALARALPVNASTEVVANDFGLIEALRDAGWPGTLVAGRLLTRQRRGPGFQSFGEVPAAAAAALRASALDAPAFVDLLVTRYGVRRFELDELVQGTSVPPLPDGVHLSLYRPWLLVTASRNCPWVFDGRAWDRDACGRPCRGRLLRLTPDETCLPVERRGGEGLVAARTPAEVPAGTGPAEGWREGEVSGARFERQEQVPAAPSRHAIRSRAERDRELTAQCAAEAGAAKGRVGGGPQRQDPGAVLFLGGCAQFLEHRSDAPPPPGVNRIVWQPEVPA